MTRRASPSPLKLQLNLPMGVVSGALPAETRAALVLALVDLLVEAAQPSLDAPSEGGADECEAHP